MAEFQAPAVVWAALALHELEPEALRCYEMVGDDVYLYLKSAVVIRVEIASLPELRVDASGRPCRTERVGHAPETARKPARERSRTQRVAKKSS